MTSPASTYFRGEPILAPRAPFKRRRLAWERIGALLFCLFFWIGAGAAIVSWIWG